MRTLFLALVGIGVIAPYTAFLPWLGRHGLDVGLFLQDMFANHIAAFFALDVLVSGTVLILAAVHAQRRGGRGLWAVILATVSVGVSAGLPLYFYYRWADSTHKRA